MVDGSQRHFVEKSRLDLCLHADTRVISASTTTAVPGNVSRVLAQVHFITYVWNAVTYQTFTNPTRAVRQTSILDAVERHPPGSLHSQSQDTHLHGCHRGR